MTTLLFDFFEKFKSPVTNAVMDHIRRLVGPVRRAIKLVVRRQNDYVSPDTNGGNRHAPVPQLRDRDRANIWDHASICARPVHCAPHDDH